MSYQDLYEVWLKHFADHDISEKNICTNLSTVNDFLRGCMFL